MHTNPTPHVAWNAAGQAAEVASRLQAQQNLQKHPRLQPTHRQHDGYRGTDVSGGCLCSLQLLGRSPFLALPPCRPCL